MITVPARIQRWTPNNNINKFNANILSNSFSSNRFSTESVRPLEKY